MHTTHITKNQIESYLDTHLLNNNALCGTRTLKRVRLEVRTFEKKKRKKKSTQHASVINSSSTTTINHTKMHLLVKLVRPTIRAALGAQLARRANACRLARSHLLKEKKKTILKAIKQHKNPSIQQKRKKKKKKKKKDDEEKRILFFFVCAIQPNSHTMQTIQIQIIIKQTKLITKFFQKIIHFSLPMQSCGVVQPAHTKQNCESHLDPNSALVPIPLTRLIVIENVHICSCNSCSHRHGKCGCADHVDDVCRSSH
jgi:hypothetical protein